MDTLFLATAAGHHAYGWFVSSIYFAATAAVLLAVENALPRANSVCAARPIDLASSDAPDFPDVEHVSNGCYISTVVYLARFLAQHPAETGQPLTVSIKCFDGPHTIALITWRGHWWGRDEYSGVFALHRRVDGEPNLDDLRDCATQALSKVAQRQLKRGRISVGPDCPGGPSLAERRAAVATAVRLLPCAAEIYSVSTRRGHVPMLFFRPFQGRIAVYDPASGTATAVCELTNVKEVVGIVATRLGYDVVGIRLESAPDALVSAAPGHAAVR